MESDIRKHNNKKKFKDKLKSRVRSVIRKVLSIPYKLYLVIEGKLRPILRDKWYDFVFSHKEGYKIKALSEIIYYIEEVEIPRQISLSGGGNSVELCVVIEFVELSLPCIGIEQFVSTKDYGRYGYNDNRYAKLLAEVYNYKGKQLKYVWFLNELEMYFDNLDMLVDKGSVENIYGGNSEYIELSLPKYEEV